MGFNKLILVKWINNCNKLVFKIIIICNRKIWIIEFLL